MRKVIPAFLAVLLLAGAVLAGEPKDPMQLSSSELAHARRIVAALSDYQALGSPDLARAVGRRVADKDRRHTVAFAVPMVVGKSLVQAAVFVVDLREKTASYLVTYRLQQLSNGNARMELVRKERSINQVEVTPNLEVVTPDGSVPLRDHVAKNVPPGSVSTQEMSEKQCQWLVGLLGAAVGYTACVALGLAIATGGGAFGLPVINAVCELIGVVSTGTAVEIICD